VRFVQDREKAIREAEAGLDAAAAAIALALDEKVHGTAQLHYGLARAIELADGDRAQCSEFLAGVLGRHPQYTGILTILPDGRMFCDSLNTGRDLDLNDRAYFRRALLAADTVVVEPVFGRLTGKAVLQIAYPARDPQGHLLFVLLASLDLEMLVRAQADIVPPGSEVLLTDTEGTVLLWLPETLRGALKGASIAETVLFGFGAAHAGGGRGVVAGPDGDLQVWSVAAPRDHHQNGLRVMVGASKAALVDPANRRLAQNLAVLAGVAVLLFAGVWAVAEVSVRQQIGRIAGMARRLGAGDLSARIDPPHPRGELGGLMEVLNGTAASLERQRKDIEDLNLRLRQAQKMEAVGQLTGGVAHDFNNLLTVILGNAEYVARGLPAGSEIRQMVEMIEQAAERGAELTRSLLAFARRQPLEPRTVDVGRQLRGMEALLARTLGEHVAVRFVLHDETWAATVDPAQLESAVLNLALNARDAMPDGGALTVEAVNARLDAAYARGDAEILPGDYVMVAVSDTGTGMPPEVAARAFEPFFTTKEVGKGSGLGLSMVYGFVKQSGGHARIYSEAGHGTTVKLYLPRAAGGGAAEESRPAASAPAGNETILMVEDDELVRAFVAGELKALGYVVLAAADGRAALATLGGDARVDLLFTDVVMPGGLSGPQLAAEARRLRPGLKILYTSGYTENAIVHHGRLDAGVRLLSKPYRRHDLARVLREVLGG